MIWCPLYAQLETQVYSQKWSSGMRCGWNRPNTNAALVNASKLPECNNTQNSHLMHDNMIFWVVGVNGVSSIKRCLLVSSRKNLVTFVNVFYLVG